MKRVVAAIALTACAVLAAQPAAAAPVTQVVQGKILRLVSVADWDAAGTLRPGQPVRWDVAVSADAPDPGTVTIAVSATGDADLVVDAALCMQEWTSIGCPGGEIILRSEWSIPRDGSKVELAQIADTETAHVRFAIALAPRDAAGRTDVRLHATGAGETAVIGPDDDDLAMTGMSLNSLWAVGGGALLLIGLAITLLRPRRAGRDGDAS